MEAWESENSALSTCLYVALTFKLMSAVLGVYKEAHLYHLGPTFLKFSLIRAVVQSTVVTLPLACSQLD